MAHRLRQRGVALVVSLALLVPTVPAMVNAATVATATTIAVVGDFGMGNTAERDVATMIAGWSPDAVLATGDDYYAAAGGSGTGRYDISVGRDYCAYLKGATPGPNCTDGGSALSNRFWSSTGNHDYVDGGGATSLGNYLSYFAFPSNERYYAVSVGPVDVFVLDSQAALASASEMSAEKAWLQAAATASTARWQVAVFHHPPYSSGQHGSSTAMRWPFASWGIDLVLNGHDHTYERSVANGIPYVVDGLGGASRYSFGTPVAESVARYNGDYGALRLVATDTSLAGEFLSLGNVTRDAFTLAATPAPPTTSLAWAGRTWAIKTSASPVGPGPNVFAAANAWTDGTGDLHLEIRSDGAGGWTTSEIVGPTLGYGTYTFSLASPVNALDPNAVLGLFTWSDAADYAHRELDIEFSRWGSATNATNAQYVVQPFGTANHLVRFAQPALIYSTHSFTWTPGKVSWESREGSSGTGALISAYAYEGTDVPLPGDEAVHLNLWLYNGVAPAAAQQVIVHSFSHVPYVDGATIGAFAKASPSAGASQRSASPTYPMRFEWSASTAALGYRVCVDQKDNGRCDTTWELTMGTSIVKSLARGKSFYWQVQAFGRAPASPVWANGSSTAWWKVSITR